MPSKQADHEVLSYLDDDHSRKECDSWSRSRERKLLTDYLSVKVKTRLLWYFTLKFCLYFVCCPNGCSSNFVECLFNLNSNFQNSLTPTSIVYHLGHIQRICDIQCNNSLCPCGVIIKRTTSLKYYPSEVKWYPNHFYSIKIIFVDV